MLTKYPKWAAKRPTIVLWAKGHEATHQFIKGLKAAKRPFNFKAAKGRKIAHHWYREAYIRYLASIWNLVSLPYFQFLMETRVMKLSLAMFASNNWKKIKMNLKKYVLIMQCKGLMIYKQQSQKKTVFKRSKIWKTFLKRFILPGIPSMISNLNLLIRIR